MRKFLIIIGSALVFLAIVLVGGTLYGMHQAEKDKNRMKTDRARQNRWKKSGSEQDPTSDPPEDTEEEQTIDTPFTVVKEEKQKEKVA